MVDKPVPPTGIHGSSSVANVQPGNPIQNPLTPVSTR